MSERKYYCLCSSNCKFETMTKEQILAAITQAVENGSVQDVDTGFVTKVKEQNAGGFVSFWVGTRAQYNALATKDASCIYILTDENVDVEELINGKFAPVDHVHDERYSLLEHNHDGKYSFGQEFEFDSGDINAATFTFAGNKSHMYNILLTYGAEYKGGIPVVIDWGFLPSGTSGEYGNFWVHTGDDLVSIKAWKDGNGYPHFEAPDGFLFRRIRGYY